MARLPTSKPTTPAIPRPGLGGRISIGRFFGEVISELRKVSWPTRQEATRLSLLVIAISTAMGILLGLFDNLFSRFFSWVAGS